MIYGFVVWKQLIYSYMESFYVLGRYGKQSCENSSNTRLKRIHFSLRRLH